MHLLDRSILQKSAINHFAFLQPIFITQLLWCACRSDIFTFPFARIFAASENNVALQLCSAVTCAGVS